MEKPQCTFLSDRKWTYTSAGPTFYPAQWKSCWKLCCVLIRSPFTSLLLGLRNQKSIAWRPVWGQYYSVPGRSTHRIYGLRWNWTPCSSPEWCPGLPCLVVRPRALVIDRQYPQPPCVHLVPGENSKIWTGNAQSPALHWKIVRGLVKFQGGEASGVG